MSLQVGLLKKVCGLFLDLAIIGSIVRKVTKLQSALLNLGAKGDGGAG